MKLSEMKHILSSGDIRLTKSLGQNFLHDGNQLRRIVAVAELQAEDKVLEIGPGLGPLTESLLPRLTLCKMAEIVRRNNATVRACESIRGSDRTENILERMAASDPGWRVAGNVRNFLP